MEGMEVIQIGKPFPGPILDQEGAILELWADRLFLIMQFPGLTRKEKRIFDQGFRRYGYMETGTPVPIAFWVFDFPKPFGAIEGSFNALFCNPEDVERFISKDRNVFSFILLDGDIVRGLKVSGLELDAFHLFYDTIQKQMTMSYDKAEFMKYLNAFCEAYGTYDILKMSRKFSHRGKKERVDAMRLLSDAFGPDVAD